jgi:hypothetical protein
MKKLIFIVAAIVFATSSFADVQSLGRNSQQMNALNAAWTAKQATHPIQSKDDITIVYGGADISNRPTLNLHTTIS